jgi:hypothetical protein
MSRAVARAILAAASGMSIVFVVRLLGGVL